jgi:hypothetical protein
MNDPATLKEFAMNGLDPMVDTGAAKQYTAFGKERLNPNPGASLWAFNYTTEEGRKQGLSAQEVEVSKKLAQLTSLVGKHFFAPFKPGFAGYEGQDLRQVKTADGKGNLYDKWMENLYNTTPVVSTLYNVLKPMDHVPLGAPGAASKYSNAVEHDLGRFREAAWIKTIQDDNHLQMMIGGKINKAMNSLTGVVPTPY